MPGQVHSKAAKVSEVTPVREHAAPVSVVGTGPSFVAFAVVSGDGEWVPTKLLIKDSQVVSTTPCGPKGVYKATAYEYLMAAVMDHYRLEGLNRQ